MASRERRAARHAAGEHHAITEAALEPEHRWFSYRRDAMPDREKGLHELLGLIDRHVDMAHCRAVDERYRRAFRWEAMDRPPLVTPIPLAAIDFPPPWNRFRPFPYRETFNDPVAMMQNHLLERVVPGLLLRDDSPLAIRNNHGTIQIASLLGGRWEQRDNEFPWVRRCETREELEHAAEQEAPDVTGGVLPRSIRTLQFYREQLEGHPVAKQALQIALPDLQGPIDTAEQLWGSDIFYAFADDADLLRRLLARVVKTTARVAQEFRRHSLDRLDPEANAQHGTQIPGRLLIRNDTSIMLRPETYGEFIRPHDAELLRLVGGGSIHFCGNGAHLVPEFLKIPDLKGLDFGQPRMMDVGQLHEQCRARRVSLIRLRPTREALMNGQAPRDFPTGVVFFYEARTLADATEVVRAYHAA